MIKPIRFTRHVSAGGGSKYLDSLEEALASRPFLGIFNVVKKTGSTTMLVEGISFKSSGGHYFGDVKFVSADSPNNKLRYDHLRFDIKAQETGLPEIYFALVRTLEGMFNYHPEDI